MSDARETQDLERLADRSPLQVLWQRLMPLLAIAACLLSLSLARTTRWTCAREPTGSRVDCVREELILGLVPVTRAVFADVRGAKMHPQTYWNESCTYVRAYLVTGQGDVVLGESLHTHEAMARQIEGFVQAGGTGSVVVKDPWWMAWEDFWCRQPPD